MCSPATTTRPTKKPAPVRHGHVRLPGGRDDARWRLLAGLPVSLLITTDGERWTPYTLAPLCDSSGLAGWSFTKLEPEGGDESGDSGLTGYHLPPALDDCSCPDRQYRKSLCKHQRGITALLAHLGLCE